MIDKSKAKQGIERKLLTVWGNYKTLKGREEEEKKIIQIENVSKKFPVLATLNLEN